MYGLAFDIGTTTLAASLVDAQTGSRIAQAGALNPQREHGADVLTRLEAAGRSPEMFRQLSLLLRKELRRLAESLLDNAPPSASPVSIGMAGNPAMEHFLLGLPVDSLARVPYRPLFRQGRTIPARDLGWDLDVDAYIFPLPGAFVGGDMWSFLHGAGVAAV